MLMLYEPLVRWGVGVQGSWSHPPPSGQQDFLEVVRIWKDGERLWLQNWLGVWVGADFVDGVLLV